MDQPKQNVAKRATTVIITFRAWPGDAAELKDAAARRRTTVSSLVRDALLQAGLLKDLKSEEVDHEKA
jgi:hypothetical protein